MEVREKDSYPKEKEKIVALFSQSWEVEGTGAANNSVRKRYLATTKNSVFVMG